MFSRVEEVKEDTKVGDGTVGGVQKMIVVIGDCRGHMVLARGGTPLTYRL